MTDYENAILSKQESEADDCSGCVFLQDCRENVGNRHYITPCSEESVLHPVYFGKL